ncbi:MAG: DNA polymerase IV [Saprospiraceae bacterium]|nr:DNA polymerase IV [Saprospiraceae bacterium]
MKDLPDTIPVRKIIHIDMDAFFASVEQRDHPEFRGKPLVVGGEGKRSVVAAASYEARKFGIYSAMPMSQARQKCKDLIIAPPRFQIYKDVSSQFREVFHEYTDLIEPLSLDEAYLDVTQNRAGLKSAILIARQIKRKVHAATGLTCTAGVSINKFLAKVASGINKPDGLTAITPPQVENFLLTLPIDKFFGVGKVTAGKMQNLGVQTGGDLRALSLEVLGKHFGKMGRYYFDVCRGVDERPVSASRIRKSISIERTFEENIYDEKNAKEILFRLCTSLGKSLAKLDLKGRTLHLKWRYPDFTTPTRSRSFQQFTREDELIRATVAQLFDENVDLTVGIRLLGVGMSNLDNSEFVAQLTLDI